MDVREVAVAPFARLPTFEGKAGDDATEDDLLPVLLPPSADFSCLWRPRNPSPSPPAVSGGHAIRCCVGGVGSAVSRVARCDACHRAGAIAAPALCFSDAFLLLPLLVLARLTTLPVPPPASP
eukprot:CAMPEP_0172568206 /NCGR_PEP_ID=MMETSP1067-20121228/119033_1 /TAXON_ID=265564 ORGANISM="Thalassiosira punctigera, Strain Tpunct2005C2" /NCGR_SAMPLE_ID=MMETSP1067 /ASSEMBLY_ACC=CAM_ASM_000444 /LENGTH=122 /DNA_ID=CAMNT_0013359751 /DNA_START=155 /DNA_END=519 /DNA_ORIENTATION=+